MINPDSDRFFKHGQFQYFFIKVVNTLIGRFFNEFAICSSFIRFLFESLSEYFMIVIS